MVARADSYPPFADTLGTIQGSWIGPGVRMTTNQGSDSLSQLELLEMLHEALPNVGRPGRS